MGFIFSKPQYQKDAEKFRHDLYARVTEFLGKYKDNIQAIHPEKKQRIARSTAGELATMMDNQQATSQEILFCFIERTATIGIQNNYVLDELFQEALIQAQACDDQRARKPGKKCWKPGRNKKQCFPPFFGVPVSVKQTIILKNKRIHNGFIKAQQPAVQDKLFILLTRKMGLIPFVRSNVPQACKTIQTNNNLFGYAKNAWNLDRSTGGSSGGQSGLISSLCSPIGIGTDIGGSLRVPAQWCGLTTIIANNRLTRLGNGFYGKFAGGITIKSVVGFLAKSTDDHIATLYFMCDIQNHLQIPRRLRDHSLNIKPLDLRIFQEKPKLKIGVVKHLSTLKCSKSHERAMNIVVRQMQDQGHIMEMVDLPYQFEQLFFFLVKIAGCNGDLSLIQQLKGDQPLTKEYRVIQTVTRIPFFIRPIISFFLRHLMPRTAKLFDLSNKISPKQIFQKVYENQVLKAQKILDVFLNNQLDAIVMPGFAFPAIRHGTVSKIPYCLPYSCGWNVIHYPVGSVPITTVLQQQTHQYNDGINDSFTRAIRESIKGSQGLPVGIQIVSTPFNEQKILYLMSQLQKRIQFSKNHPYPY